MRLFTAMFFAIFCITHLIAHADGSVSIKIGNGIGAYNSAIDDLGSWNAMTNVEWASVTTKSYRCIYPNLNILPGNNKIVTSASWNLYYRYDADGTHQNYALGFYNAREHDTGGLPYYSYAGWQDKPSGAVYSFPVDNSIVQGWIDTPASNAGISFDRGTSGTGTLVWGALDNQVLARRPYLSLTYSYTGDIPPPLPVITAPTPGWSIKGNVNIVWAWPDDISMDTSDSTVQIDVKLSGTETWTTIANGVPGNDLSWTWDTSQITPGSYFLRIRSEATETVYSNWHELTTPIILTEKDYSLVNINNLIKVQQSEVISIPSNTSTPEWFAAKGEGEALQLIFIPHKDLTNVQLRLGTFSDGNGHTIPSNAITLYVQEYTNCTVNVTGTVGTPGYWPDALIPVIDPAYQEERRAANINVPNFKNVPLLIDAFVPRDQAAGYYTGNVIVNGDGLTEYQMPVRLRVRDFTLPATASLPSTNLIDPGRMALWHTDRATKDAIQTNATVLWKLYRDTLLKYRLSADPGGWTAYKTDYNTSTEVAAITSTMDAQYLTNTSGNPAIDYLTTAYNIGLSWPKADGVSQNPPSAASWVASWSAIWSDMGARGWQHVGYVYLADEPKVADFIAVGTKAQQVKRGAPNFKTLITSGLRRDSADGIHSLESYNDWIDVWCPVINLYESSAASHGNGVTNLDAVRAAGDEVWTYTSNMSISDRGAPGYFIDYPNGTYARILNWIAWFYNIDGLLYFDTAASWAASSTNPYTNVYRYNGNGDGTLWYPGATGLIGGSHGIPIPSNRLNYIRDGFEDYEYMSLLKTMGKKAAANAAVAQMIPVDRASGTAVRNWVKDPNLMQLMRAQMADAIEGKVATSRGEWLFFKVTPK